jgi:hypothetical protein
LKNGLGIEIEETGSKYIGTWKNGHRHGSGRFFWADGAFVENRNYENGVLISSTLTTL